MGDSTDEAMAVTTQATDDPIPSSQSRPNGQSDNNPGNSGSSGGSSSHNNNNNNNNVTTAPSEPPPFATPAVEQGPPNTALPQLPELPELGALGTALEAGSAAPMHAGDGAGAAAARTSHATEPDPHTQVAAESRDTDGAADDPGMESEPKPTDSGNDPIGTASPIGQEGPVCQITLLLTSGSRHPYKIDEKYLAKRNVSVPELTESGRPDPFSISVYTLKELILREWRDEWEGKPASPSSIRLIHLGKLLDDKNQLKGYNLNAESPNVVHMTVRPQDIIDEEEPKGNGKSGLGRSREVRCCTIL